MIDLRLQPYVQDESISIQELLELLSESEEFGGQHIFLYVPLSSKATEVAFNRSRLESALAGSIGFPALNAPKFAHLPENPTVVDVTYGAAGHNNFLKIKRVVKRYKEKRNKETVTGGQRLVTFDRQPYRAVDVIRIWEDGLLEVRIHSHAEKIDYHSIVNEFLESSKNIVNKSNFTSLSLDKVKEYLWSVDNRESVNKKFAIRNGEHRNAHGSIFRSATSVKDSILEEEHISDAIDRYSNERSRGVCESLSFYFRKTEPLQRHIGVTMRIDNEFFIATQLTASEYTHILETIIDLNKNKQ